jgi:hypothetical protein
LPGVLLRLVLGHEIEGLLRMVLRLRPFATPLRHVLAAFSKAVLPQSRRKSPANNFVTVEHRGIWSARMIVATVPSVSSARFRFALFLHSFVIANPSPNPLDFIVTRRS